MCRKQRFDLVLRQVLQVDPAEFLEKRADTANELFEPLRPHDLDVLVESRSRPHIARPDDHDVLRRRTRVIVLEPRTGVVHLPSLVFVDFRSRFLDLVLAFDQQVLTVTQAPKIVGALLPLFVGPLRDEAESGPQFIERTFEKVGLNTEAQATAYRVDGKE